ncbi:MAG: hypothetical protein GY913_28675 [Proteobacteria bacterium]|nr:hypothetical protein [Pseudomonadota bacterium]MCP4920888.1 hypothetical protein [Pseudomonadota bacterium]
MATKPPTIASLVRIACQSHKMYVENTCYILMEGEPERIIEYFTRLSLPRAWAEEDRGEWHVDAFGPEGHTLADELHLMEGMVKYIDRNARKIKWHISHPGEPDAQASGDAVALVFAAQGEYAAFRIRRVLKILDTHKTLTAKEWGQTRELLNRAYRDYRLAVQLVTTRYLEELLGAADPEDAMKALQGYPAIFKEHTAILDGLRDEIEVMRQTLAVQPEGYPIVRPPRYFGGDLLDTPSWKHFWGEVGTLSDNMRQHVGLGI